MKPVLKLLAVAMLQLAADHALDHGFFRGLLMGAILGLAFFLGAQEAIRRINEGR